jgi:hypothetical protein
MKTVLVSLLVFLTAALSGCKPSATRDLPATVPAEGVVTLDGSPVDGATVTFHADAGSHHATATTDASGKFALRAFPEKPGAVAGSYKVEVNKTIVSEGGAGSEDGESEVVVSFGLPQKYASITTSELTCVIPEAGATDIKLELTSD